MDTAARRECATRLAKQAVARLGAERLARGLPIGSEDDDAAVVEAVLSLLFGHLGPLQPIMDAHPDWVQIDANGCDRVWVTLADGTKLDGGRLCASDGEMVAFLQELARRLGFSERSFSPAEPSLKLALPDGSRLNALGWICARPSLSVRRHPLSAFTLDGLVAIGAVDGAVAALLAAAVTEGANVVVSGPMGSGKTTCLRALAGAIPTPERFATIETDPELGLDQFPERHPDVLSLVARPANVEGVGQKTMADLVVYALGMSVRRIVVGEVLGPEAVPMLTAMNLGSPAMCTLHANSATEVFNRLALLGMAAPERLTYEYTSRLAAAAIDLVVHMAPLPEGRWGGVVSEVIETAGIDEAGTAVVTHTVARPDADGLARLEFPAGSRLQRRLLAAGYDLQPLAPSRRTEGWCA
ncbi:MAG TPA: ATPase, T2SS/T4P/T4SS family [Acidimicrobiia bacterium]|nr:ATPase, T2SS/T4P/T4SS family [Acidimicrobiia bacterium]